MALGTLATIAIATSAVAGISQAKEARDTRKEQQRRLEQQQKEARDRARARAELRDTREDTGAEVQLGTDDTTPSRTIATQDRGRRRTRRSGLSNIGGLTSSRVGL